MVTAAPMEARQLAAACLARLSELFPAAKVVIGIGGICRDPRDVARSYAQAQRTTQTLQRLGRSGARGRSRRSAISASSGCCSRCPTWPS